MSLWLHDPKITRERNCIMRLCGRKSVRRCSAAVDHQLLQDHFADAAADGVLHAESALEKCATRQPGNVWLNVIEELA